MNYYGDEIDESCERILTRETTNATTTWGIEELTDKILIITNGVTRNEYLKQ